VAGEGPSRFWPLFDLVVRTPRLELRLPREEEFGAVIELVDSGIHDPGTMPFFIPWTEVEPTQRARESAQWWWRHRAEWSPGRWTFTGIAFVDGQPVGAQDLEATHFRAVRSVETGSWLGRAHQGQGLGREMREAVLHLAFAGLGAEEALSGAFEDNAASLATSRAVGYEENGEARGRRRDGSGRTIRFRLGRDVWERRRRADIEIIGLEGCLDMFVGPAG
jgi:RimJ/RimL family protein N-acetyltransferase